MKKEAVYEQMIKRTAFQIVNSMKAFDGEPDHVRTQCEQIVMQRVQRMRGGDGSIIDGDDLIKEVSENPEPAAETA